MHEFCGALNLAAFCLTPSTFASFLGETELGNNSLKEVTDVGGAKPRYQAPRKPN
jgi:hypothetical protein